MCYVYGEAYFKQKKCLRKNSKWVCHSEPELKMVQKLGAAVSKGGHADILLTYERIYSY